METTKQLNSLMTLKFPKRTLEDWNLNKVIYAQSSYIFY